MIKHHPGRLSRRRHSPGEAFDLAPDIAEHRADELSDVGWAREEEGGCFRRRELRTRAQAVIDAAEGRPGHIFNLGHGVLPDMKPENVKALVEMVHEMGQR